jgi:capsule polysaccharide modification protein KpsS
MGDRYLLHLATAMGESRHQHVLPGSELMTVSSTLWWANAVAFGSFFGYRHHHLGEETLAVVFFFCSVLSAIQYYLEHAEISLEIHVLFSRFFLRLVAWFMCLK